MTQPNRRTPRQPNVEPSDRPPGTGRPSGLYPPEQNWPRWTLDYLWAPLTAGIVILLVGLLAGKSGQAALFPSFAPTAYMLAATPQSRMTRLYNVIVGHLVGLGAGFLAVFALGATQLAPVIVSGYPQPPQVWASVLAITWTVLGAMLLRASHPPAAATTLLVALGALQPTPHDVKGFLMGLAVTAVAGETVRRLRLGDWRLP